MRTMPVRMYLVMSNPYSLCSAAACRSARHVPCHLLRSGCGVLAVDTCDRQEMMLLGPLVMGAGGIRRLEVATLARLD